MTILANMTPAQRAEFLAAGDTSGLLTKDQATTGTGVKADGVVGALAAQVGGVLATDIPSLSVPADVNVIRLAGYNAASKGMAAPTYIRTTKPGVKAYRIQDANGQRWQLIADTIRPKELGATGRDGTDSTQGFLEAFGYAKELQTALLTAAPDEIHPRGLLIELGSGKFNISQPMPLFDRLVVQGSGKAYGADRTHVYTDGPAFFTMSQRAGRSNAQLQGFQLEGVFLYGKNDRSTRFILEADDSYSIAMTACLIEHNQFSHMQAFKAFMTVSHFSHNEFTDMTSGNFVIGGSDTWVEYNLCNGDGAPNHTAVCSLIQFDNSRLNHNYITGASPTGNPPSSAVARPVPLYMQNCEEVDAYFNWLDLSDGAAMVLNDVRRSRFGGNRLCELGNNPPTLDTAGNAVEGSRNCAARVLIGCRKLTFQDIIRDAPVATANILSNGAVECDEITFDDITENHLGGLIRNGTISWSKTIVRRDRPAMEAMKPDATGGRGTYAVSGGLQTVGSAGAPVAFTTTGGASFTGYITPNAPTGSLLVVTSLTSGTINLGTTIQGSGVAARTKIQGFVQGDSAVHTAMTMPFVMQGRYSNAGATNGLILNVPTAIPGRVVEVFQATGSYVTGINIVAGEVIRGQGASTGIRLPASDRGKFIRIECVEAGTWEYTTNGASVTFV